MARYFFDTEFLEGTQKTLFGKTKPTIDLISIGIVSEDGRKFYAISNEFNLKEAWNRYDIKVEQVSGDLRNIYPEGIKTKEYWIRQNVLRPIFDELVHKWALEEDDANQKLCTTGYNPPIKFNIKNLKKLIRRYGKSNYQISRELYHFVIEGSVKPISFYGYYSDYDWVCLCWLFGKMISLPKGFPMYCRDVKQMFDEAIVNKHLGGNENSREFGRVCNLVKEQLDYPKNENDHHALSDAIWTKDLYEFVLKMK